MTTEFDNKKIIPQPFDASTGANTALKRIKARLPSLEGKAGKVLKVSSNEEGCEWSTGGGGGTSDYDDLTNKPQINSVELSGNKSLSDIGAASAADLVSHTGNTNIHVTAEQKTAWTGKQDAITSTAKLSADLVDDTSATNKFNVQSDWNSDSGLSQVLNRPFKTIGTGLTVTSDALTADTQFKFQIFATLPTASATYAQTIALVLKETTESGNIYDEYGCVSNGSAWSWERIGGTSFTLNIVQNNSGITINDTVLQTGNATRTGLVTSSDWSTFNGKQDALTFDDAPTASSNNPVKSSGVHTALAGKQDTLTFDNTPTASSTNPVTSGGVYTALAGKQDTIATFTGTLTVAGWDSTTKTQTISATGVTASNVVIVSPAPAGMNYWSTYRVYCSAQGAGTLTFTCSEVPAYPISVNAVIV